MPMYQEKGIEKMGKKISSTSTTMPVNHSPVKDESTAISLTKRKKKNPIPNVKIYNELINSTNKS